MTEVYALSIRLPLEAEDMACRTPLRPESASYGVLFGTAERHHAQTRPVPNCCLPDV